jgi:hypothetical protein
LVLEIPCESAEVLHNDIANLTPMSLAKGKHPLELASICGTCRFSRINKHVDNWPSTLLAEFATTLLLIDEVERSTLLRSMSQDYPRLAPRELASNE